jgi:GTP-binding protein
MQQRFFAAKREAPRHTTSHKRPATKKTHTPRARRLPPGVFLPEKADSVDVPPAYLMATASPHVYVASCAMEGHDIDPQSFFTEGEKQHHFYADYVSYIETKDKLQKWNIPEVAFLGRSNVGKSSLVNALLKKKDLARCSKTPGRTQQVNYYGLFRHQNDMDSPSRAAGFFVDLPGYGFAKAPPDQVRKWQARTQKFLLNRRDARLLRRLFLLVDARRGTSQMDRDIMGWFDEATIPYSVVLTKADRVGRPQIVKFVNEICMRHHSQVYGEVGGSQGPVVHVTSAQDGYGIRELMTSIQAEFVGHGEEGSDAETGNESIVEDDQPWLDYQEDNDER